MSSLEALQQKQPTGSDWAELVEMRRDDAAEIRIIKASYAQLAEQTADIRATLREQDRRIGENAAQLQAISEDVGATKKMTSDQMILLHDVKDAVMTASVLSKAAKWTATLALTCSALWIAIKDVVHWTPKP